MATLTFTINTNAAQDAAIKKAMEWRAHRTDESAVPKTPGNVPALTATAVKAEVRDIMLQFFRSEAKSELSDLRRAIAAADAEAESGDVDDIS